MDITKKMSPNFSSGREGTPVDRIVIHWVGEGDAHSAANYFQSPNSQVSAHYIIGNDVLYQCVNENDTAWHANNWEMNLRSIGIEHEARPDLPMTDEIYKRSGELVRQICADYNIPLDRTHIIGHREVKATQCPGTIDIDRIIQEAKMDQENQCEKELEEMRESRNKWKQKCYDTEQTLETERDDYAKTIKEKNQQIDSLNESNSRLNESNARLSKENETLTERNLEAQNTIKELGTELETEKTMNISLLDRNQKLSEELSELKTKYKKKLCGQSRWTVFWSLFKRRC